MRDWVRSMLGPNDMPSLHQLAASDRNGEAIQTAIRRGANPDAPMPPQGLTPLHIAVLNDNVVAARAFLDSGANPVSRDREGVTPFQMTILKDCASPNLVQLLINRGGMKAFETYAPPSPRHELWDYSFWRDQDDATIIAALDDVPEINDSDSVYHDHKPIHMAAGADCGAAVIEALVQRGANPNLPNHNGNISLHLAAQRSQNPELIATLLRYGSYVNARNVDGNTPLHSAARDNHSLPVIETLINYGSALFAENNDSLTPIGVAVQFRNHTTVAYLQEQEEKWVAAMETYSTAVIACMSGDHGTALQMSNEAVSLYPGLAKPYKTRALAHAAMGYITDAIKDLERFVELADDDLDECWFTFNQMTALNPTGMLGNRVHDSTREMLNRKTSEKNKAALTSMGIDTAELNPLY